MTSLFCRGLVVVALAGVVCASSDASAQVGPPQALFGGARADDSKTRLDFTASLTEGYDSDVPADLRSTVDPFGLDSGGFSTIANGTAAYSTRQGRAEIGANINSTVRYYADLGETRSLGHSGGLGASVRLPARTTLLINQTATYSPTNLYGLFPTGDDVKPGSSGSTAPDYSVNGVTSYASYLYSTLTTLRHELSPRANVSASGEFLYTDRVRNRADWQDMSVVAFRGEYSWNLARNKSLSARAQYRSGETGYVGDGRTQELRLDLSARFVRPLSPTRQTTVRFNLGPVIADVAQVGQGTGRTTRQYIVVGEVDVDHPFGRGWRTHVHYRRGLEYVVDLPEPVFADGFSAGVDGLISRRVDVSVSAGYSSGASLLNARAMAYDSYTGTVRARYALSRTSALYVEYLYYYYDFLEPVPLVTGIPRGLERSGIRAGLTLWIPSLRR